jgi:hypothetical protein
MMVLMPAMVGCAVGIESALSGECPRCATGYALGCREDRQADESEA